MAYEKPAYSLNKVDRAGTSLFNINASDEELDRAVAILSNWRAAHSYPLNALNMTLKNRAHSVDQNASIAQRLKRWDSVVRKLERWDTMHLSQMQDIGGCRAVVDRITDLYELVALYQSRPLRHSLHKTRDYINFPKNDGYRSVHLMYRFSGKATSLPWDKLRVEIQLRTKLQHAWATAVETVDAFTGQSLKFGEGEQDWRRFFALMGSVHANIEQTPTIPGAHNTNVQLAAEVRLLERKLLVVDCLNSFAQITQFVADQRGITRDWYLIRLMPEQKSVTVKGFPKFKLKQAEEELAKAEREFKDTRNQALLASADSLKELKKAYPNYFADTRFFTSVLRRFLSV